MIAAASIITAVKSELSAYKSIKNDYVSKSILTQIVCQLHEITRIEKVSVSSSFICPTHLGLVST